MNANPQEKKVVIVGGGFGGIRAALDLAKKKNGRLKIALISDKSYFNFTPSLYRVVGGRNPFSACFTLREVFKNKEVEVLQDYILDLDVKQKKVISISGSHHDFDFLILALGSETVFYDIPGLKELSFSLKSVDDAIRLNRHLHQLFNIAPEAKPSAINIVIIGGGATGVELAGELAIFTKELAKKHKIDPSLITIDLIERGSKILGQLPQSFSEKVQKRLQSLGVNIFLNRQVVKEEAENLYLKDTELKTKTVIWAGGVKAHHFYQNIKGFTYDQKGRVVVDEFLQAAGFENIFVIGDGAATKYSGLAQTAIGHGHYTAKVIFQKINGEKVKPYLPNEPSYAVPIGPNWAAVMFSPLKLKIYGRLGSILRQVANLKFFISILPIKTALEILFSKKDLCELCEICYTIEHKVGS